MLRQSVEFALRSRVRVAYESFEVGVPGPSRHVERVHHERSRHRTRRLPAHQSAREHVDDEGHVDDAGPRGAIREIRHPELIGTSGDELTLHEVGCAQRVLVGVGGEALLGARGALNALLFHQSRHLVATALQVLEALDVCLVEDCTILPMRMEDGIVRPAHARQVVTWAFEHLYGDTDLSRATAGRLLRGVGRALRRAESPAYAVEVYRNWLSPYLSRKGACTKERKCERCAQETGTCDFVSVMRRCVDAYVHDAFSPFAKPSRKRANEFLPGNNPDVKRHRGRPPEGFYGELRRDGYLDAAGYGVARVADVRRVEGGRQWAYQLLRKAWEDGCRTPRLAEMLASMTVVDGIGLDSAGDEEPDPKAPYHAAIAVIDECLVAYANQSGKIFERLASRRERLERTSASPPREKRDLNKAVNRRSPHPTILGRPPSTTRGLSSAPPKVVVRLAPPTFVRRRGE